MVGDNHRQAIRPLLTRAAGLESSVQQFTQHQFTLTLVPWWLTLTEQSTG
jgi:hypothetical protein